jgi:hypothetical protein
MKNRYVKVVATVAFAGLCGVHFLSPVAAQQNAAATTPAKSVTIKAIATVPAAKSQPVVAEGEAAGRELTPLEKEMLTATDRLVSAFNESSVEKLLDTFLPEGELIDEEGNLHAGHEEIKTLATTYFEKFPATKTQATLESVRQVGDLVFTDGSRVVSSADGRSFSALRFAAVWKKTESGYRLVSLRDFSDAQPLTPHEALKSLEWIAGEWVNEGSDARVELAFRWSDDENFILGEITVRRGDTLVARSSQRIGYDAARGIVRSWTFDSDGGFGASEWEPGDNGWVLQSAATGPDGAQASATMSIMPVNEDRFTIRVSNRVSEGREEADYEYTVVRKPPAARK